MCIDKLLNLINPGTSRLPHPEEKFSKKATVDNVSVDVVLLNWMEYWAVPLQYRNFWKEQIVIELYNEWPEWALVAGAKPDSPAFTWDAEDGKRHLACKPGYLNPGVIAHEQAHNSYSFLRNHDKQSFAVDYETLLETDPDISYLYSVKQDAMWNKVEGHAEIYRYIGQYLPDGIKRYYPKLF